MKEAKKTTWDLVVIGGGPSGMMAAGRAAELGASVLLIEKNEILGKKLLITGGGRCNLTNAEFDTRKFLSKFKENDKFLFSPFSKFGVKESIDFFEDKGMPTKVEEENRVFPKSNSARSVWNILVQYMKKNNVTILSNSPVSGFLRKDEKITSVKLKNGDIIKGKYFVLATGGKSRPETGSTGEGFSWLKMLGHTITQPNPALVPVATSDKWVAKLKGVSLGKAGVNIFQNDEKHSSREGKVLFTHFGLSGPAILNSSKDIGELLKYGEVVVSLDLFPKLNQKELDMKVQEAFKKYINKKFKNSLVNMLPDALAEAVIKFSGIDKETPCHSISKEERKKLVQTLKGLEIKVERLLSVKKAIVTSGGIDLKEVDFKTMSSKIYSNIYLVGDVLNIDRPSGGYSLQICWTTGYVAGTDIGEKIKSTD